jgi:hypothetical protein
MSVGFRQLLQNMTMRTTVAPAAVRQLRHHLLHMLQLGNFAGNFIQVLLSQLFYRSAFAPWVLP